MTAYYNEHDPYAAQWLRNLITAERIAPGEVDERSIKDVRPDDLAGYAQCHFFAGIGVWSHALRLAGWPDDRPVWTGSCPCQPFSAAGKGDGVDDERHLWPAWFHLIEQCRPDTIFGEQVEAAIKHGWLDLVQSDMEGIGYAFAAVGLPAAGVGAPHIRQRLWFVADDNSNGRETRGEVRPVCKKQNAEHGGPTRKLDNPNNAGLEGLWERHQATSGWFGPLRSVAEAGESRGLAHTDNERHEWYPGDGRETQRRLEYASDADWPCATHGFWRDADWLGCRDGKWRPVEPKFVPLAHGASARVGRLRAYGNAIVPQVAAQIIAAYMEA